MSLTSCLERLLASPDNQPYALLCRGLRRQLHGWPDVVFFGAIGLAAFSGYIAPLHVFSFHVWFAIYFAHLFSSPLRFVRRTRRSGTLENQLLATPVPSSDYAGAVFTQLLLLTFFGLVPYILYYAVLFRVDPRFTDPIRLNAYAWCAGYHFIVITGMLWAATWAAIAGRDYLIIKIAYYLGYASAHAHPAIMDIKRWPVDSHWIVLGPASWATGLFIAAKIRNDLVNRLTVTA